MGESPLQALEPELYERLIDRLGLALDVARASVRLRDEMPAELELRGLSHAEFEVIKAYLASRPERNSAHIDTLQQPEAPVGRVVWLKDKARSATMTKSRALHFK
ncbi:hypothetical protein GCM10009504_14460 [Pseudomonas laurentiana]|uniref:Uncharacterized protein n=1 Tax=Pseudomonas laurentiana TaxID=2364649 RepID=A0A6I5RQY1_9PSED|nr:hypothetical protein [Pseudomonas laurentiana]NES10377.1 hypothetical protein [Pseudomonas laurentiana]GGU58612.1 hypothetical protein GCM10009504_14460 [Pseudomonas laurentiana]